MKFIFNSKFSTEYTETVIVSSLPSLAQTSNILMFPSNNVFRLSGQTVYSGISLPTNKHSKEII